MKTQTSKTAAVMNLISRGTAPAVVDGGQVPAVQGERTIETITGEILEAKRVGGEAILTIGRGLIEAKELLSHGEWLPWLTERVEFSERTAQNFMKLARNWSNPQALADLGATKALVLLALPADERDSFMAENHIVDGEEKTVIDMSARELEKAIKDREEALAAKTAAENLMENALEQRDEAQKELEISQAALRASEQELVNVTQKLEALLAAPKEVAVETVVDQKAVEKARIDAIGEMQSKMAEALDAREKAEEGRKAAEEALAAANAKLDAAAKAEKPSAITSDALVAQFQVYFDQAQTIANQMHGLLIKARNREDGSTAERLEKALMALSDKIREGAA